ncbi:Acyl-coenzyme A thioesterase 13 [Phlyctochytrium planicorne]|nr:Acyl-coenzyme A thioesterase 13 [Phlyctochytrium planicorne]
MSDFAKAKTREEKVQFVNDVITALGSINGDFDPWDRTLMESMKVVDAEKGRVSFHYTVQKNHANGRGFVHGGCIATIVDVCSSIAIFTVEVDGYSGVSTDLSVSFTSAAKVGDTLLVVAEVSHHGRLLDFTSTTISTMDVEGKPKKQVARGLHTKFVVKSKL